LTADAALEQMMATASTHGSERLRVAWEAHKDRLWRALFAWSGEREVASDSVAEAFAQAARRGEAIDDVGRWVWRTAFRIAGGLLAARRAEHLAGSIVDEPARDALPDEVVALLDALDRLRPDDRAAIILAYVGGWTASEIASLTDSTSGAVRVRLHRARGRLRTALEVADA
jgi:RNA polymerase sigma-70 factor, ECF subfamily